MPDSNVSSPPPADSTASQKRWRSLFLALIAIAVLVAWSQSQNAGNSSGSFRSGLFEMPGGSPPSRPSASSAPSNNLEAPSQPKALTTQSAPDPVMTAAPQKTASSKMNVEEERQPAVDDTSARLIGRWEDNFYGRRVFTFAEGGKAEMVIELDSVGALLYGPKLKFFIDWTLEGDVLTLTMTGGEPSDTTKTVSQLFGNSSQRRIEAINDQEMKLRSLDSQKLYTHKRLASPEQTPAAQK